jgi:glycerol kinase
MPVRASKPAHLLLAIDQGTTSTRAQLFDEDGRVHGEIAQRELPQVFPSPGLVEHDPEEIWRATVATCSRALEINGLNAADIAGIGITNQRETVVVWERATGRPIHNAIVWQDRRTAACCERLDRAGAARLVQTRTGLLLDPYFSATKIAWILDHVDGARSRAERGELAAGTIDSFLLWRLTGGRVHATDATNASRTSLLDIHRQAWDDELLELFHVPRSLLPEVRDSAGDFGETEAELLGAPIPLRGVVGDQQSAAIGQACWEPGTSKCTYGTGAFVLLNTGTEAPVSHNRLLTTVAYRLDGETRYAMEGSIFSAGSTIQWLRDGLGLFTDAADTEAMARRADPTRRVHVVPAFTGLGAPHWDADARGAILGLTRDANADDIVRASLDAVAFQTAELLQAMEADGSPRLAALRVDGGMAANDWFLQRLADLLGVPIERPVVTETTALGAALLAGWALGLCPSTQELAARWELDRRFDPVMSADERTAHRADWDAAVRRVRSTPS